MQINITRRNSKRDRQRSSIRAVEICRALSKSALIIPALFDEAVSCMAKALVEFPTLIETDAKKIGLAQKFTIIKNPQFLANPYETWLK